MHPLVRQTAGPDPILSVAVRGALPWRPSASVAPTIGRLQGKRAQPRKRRLSTSPPPRFGRTTRNATSGEIRRLISNKGHSYKAAKSCQMNHHTGRARERRFLIAHSTRKRGYAVEDRENEAASAESTRRSVYVSMRCFAVPDGF